MILGARRRMLSSLHIFENMEYVVVFAIGAGCGAALVFWVLRQDKQQALLLAQQMWQKASEERQRDAQQLLQQVQQQFGALSLEALTRSSQEFLKLADSKLRERTTHHDQTLEQKKALIDQTLVSVLKEMEQMQRLVIQLEKGRENQYGHIAQQLMQTAEQATKLQETTQQLRAALSNARTRGQWGERIADDVLRATGLTEGIHYVRQQTSAKGTRPDFTFLLPNQLRIHMDVKFPLDNYMRCVESQDDTQRRQYREAFVRDVRQRIREISGRDYINPAEGTADYVLLFIPNEQVYHFAQESDTGLMDEALRQKAILCSPLTLYALLSVIRQGAEHFQFERKARELLRVIGDFRKQWSEFADELDRMGKGLDTAQKAYQQMMGVRRQKLDTVLVKMEELRQATESAETLPPAASQQTLEM